jgi:hypothetical protein
LTRALPRSGPRRRGPFSRHRTNCGFAAASADASSLGSGPARAGASSGAAGAFGRKPMDRLPPAWVVPTFPLTHQAQSPTDQISGRHDKSSALSIVTRTAYPSFLGRSSSPPRSDGSRPLHKSPLI